VFSDGQFRRIQGRNPARATPEYDRRSTVLKSSRAGVSLIARVIDLFGAKADRMVTGDIGFRPVAEIQAW
jgi:hypothetical protein